MERKKIFRSVWFWVVLVVLVALGVSAVVGGGSAYEPVRTSVALQQIEDGNVESVTINDKEQTLDLDLREAVDGNEQISASYPIGASDDVFSLVSGIGTDGERTGDGVAFTTNVTQDSILASILISFLPFLILLLLLFWLFNSMQGGGRGVMAFGKSKAKQITKDTPKTTFADVAGADEAIEELQEIKDFLANPVKFQAVGASRVRDLFSQAKAVAPSIVFIDELDAIGRARGGTVATGGVDEREQTLNQVLTEMDGFEGNPGVVVLAATNRPEVLDPALLRPGRFDRRVSVGAPDRDGRADILRVHTRAVPLAPDVDLGAVAAATPGMVGADLANLVNEAALLAAAQRREQVTAADFGAALEKIVLGTVRGIVLAPEEKLSTAYHEAGHALLGMLTPGADPVRRVTIIPRGQALGVTVQTPQDDRYGYSARYLRGRIVGALGGRAAEEVVYDDVTTGAASDLEQATSLARQMVGRWGMSAAVGPVAVLPSGPESPFGPDPVAPATRELVDAEVRRLLEECYAEAVATLRGNRERLDRLARTLLDRETLDEDEAYAAAGVPPATAPAAVARGEVPGADRVPGMPPEAAGVPAGRPA